jgi:polygalacturonase
MPIFQNELYKITEYGAVSDGSVKCTESINKAINICSANGGGTVLIPEGIFLTGPIHLKSNVNLHLEEGAILKFSTSPSDYLPAVLTRWEGVDCYNYSPFIYAYQQENIAITGKGILDGQSDNTHWWSWKDKSASGEKTSIQNQSNSGGRDRLMKYNQNAIPVEERIFGEGNYLRPPFIQIYQCKYILIEDVNIINSPFWAIHLLLSESIIVRGVHINSTGPNNDGCNPESCKYVLIENCSFNTGDDCIAVKSGRDNDGRRWDIPSENIVIRNCEMREGHGGVTIGSETSGGCRNLFVTDCKMNSPQLERAIRIKTNAERGGTIENIYIRNVEIGRVKEAVFKIDCIYETKSEQGNYPPLIQNIHLENITSQKSKYPVYLVGLTSFECIKDIYLTHITFDGIKKANKISGVSNIVFKDVLINGELYELE